ncbi:TIR domain-containing protein [Prosthecobacter fluviatilis]|uniref:TIR domain-containing protein n=1 Tax=Prosthecobacter fluviatilis TaxID=445931 RepID=A0ABW0KUX1_9BACT
MSASSTSHNEAGQRHYAVFISYRHADNKESGRQWANWLHDTLEGYVVPPELVGTANLRGGQVPASLYPVFRDEAELPADADLSNNIKLALERSDLLVVLCSPRAVQSRYVAEEIRYFKELGRSSRVLALMIDGEPNVTDDAGKSGLECLPEPLRYGAAREDGSVDWSVRVEPIAADVRPQGRPEQGWTSAALYGRELKKRQPALGSREVREAVVEYEKRLNEAVLKIVAGGLGVPFGVLTQRDQVRALAAARRRGRVLMRLAAGFALLALAAAVAGVVAWQMRGKAERSELTVRQNAGRSEFTTATDWMRQGVGDKALAHYAKSLRLDPHNSSSAFCILTLLGRKSWPVLLREFAGPHMVRRMRLLPDEKRLVTARALDAYSVMGKASLQVWDWRTSQLLTRPLEVGRREVVDMRVNAAGTKAHLTLVHKGIDETHVTPLPAGALHPFSFAKDDEAHAKPLQWLSADEPLPLNKDIVPAGDQRVLFKTAATGLRLCENFRHESAVTAQDALHGHLFATGTALGFARVWTRTDAPWPTVAVAARKPAQAGNTEPVPPGPFQSDSNTEGQDELFATAPDGKTKVWGRRDGSRRKPYLELDGKKVPLDITTYGGMYVANFSNDGRLLALRTASGLLGSSASLSGLYNDGASLYDARTGAVLRSKLPHDGCSWTGFDHSGRWLITLGNGSIQCWDSTTGERSGPAFQHPGVSWMATDPKRPNRLLSFSEHGQLRIWDVEKGVMLYESDWPAGDSAKAVPGAEALHSAALDPERPWFIQREPGGMVFRSLETGDPLTDVLPHVSLEMNPGYEQLVRLLGWDAVLAKDFSAAAEALATAAEAVAGLYVNDFGIIAPLRDTAAAFQRVEELLKPAQPGESTAVHALLGKLTGQPQLRPLLETPAAKLAENAAEGRAVMILQKAVEESAMQHWEDHTAELRWAVDQERMQNMREIFQEARRAAPAPAERLIRELQALWAERTDAMALFLRVDEGDRSPEVLAQAMELLVEYQTLLDADERTPFNYAAPEDLRDRRLRYEELQRSAEVWKLPLPSGPYASAKTGGLLATGEEQVYHALDKVLNTQPFPKLDVATLRSWYEPLLKEAVLQPDRRASSRYFRAEPLLEWLARPDEKPGAEMLERRLAFAESLIGDFTRHYQALLLIKEGVRPHVSAKEPLGKRALRSQIWISRRIARQEGWSESAAVMDSIFPLVSEYLGSGGAFEEIVNGSTDAFEQSLVRNLVADVRFPFEQLPAGLQTKYAGLLARYGEDSLQPRAAALLQAAMKAGPLVPEQVAALGSALYREKKYAEAAPLLRQAAETLPKSGGLFELAPILYRECYAWLHTGADNLVEAEAAAKRHVAAFPAKPEGHYFMGQVLEKRGLHAAQMAEFVLAVKAAIRGGPSYSDYVVDVLGKIDSACTKAGTPAEAEAVANQLIAEFPKNPEGHRFLGGILQGREQPAKAAAAFAYAVKFAQEQGTYAYPLTYVTGVLRQLGTALGKAGNLADAEKAFDHATGLLPQDGGVARQCGWAAFNVGLHAKALSYWQTAHKLLGEKNEDAMAGVAVGHWSTGDKPAAVAAYQKLIALNADYGKADYVAKLDWTKAEVAVMTEILAALPKP